MTAPILEAQDLSVAFGGVRAVDAVDLWIEPGRLVGLIGPNGAGKTTCIDALTGFVASRGRVRFAGRDISRLPAHRRARAGLSRTWQSLELFDDLTVRENLEVAAERASARDIVADLVRPRRSRDRGAVDGAIDALGLRDVAHARPTELSHGRRKLVGVARALAARPAVVCMDEPAAGLDTAESRALGGRLRAITDTGVTILLVDHDMGLVLGVCDDVFVLEFGQVIAHGTPDEIRNDARVIGAYLGDRAQHTMT